MEVATTGALRRGGGGSLGDWCTADFLVLRGQLILALGNLGYSGVDFGWGKPGYGRPASPTFVLSFLLAVRNGDAFYAIVVTVVLPPPAMDRFTSKLKILHSV